jgi:Retroviral aspartyl protease.
VNHIQAETAQEAPDVVMGMFFVNSIPALVLFDSGASHSFISQAFVKRKWLENPKFTSTYGNTFPWKGYKDR